MKQINLLCYDGATFLDIAGIAQVFSCANELSRRSPYTIKVVMLSDKDSATDTGIRIVGEPIGAELCEPGTLVIPGSYHIERLINEPKVISRVRGLLAGQNRILTSCSGSLLLAATGVLNGRVATCHHQRLSTAIKIFPKVAWQPDILFTEDGAVFTSAGVTASVDAALRMVELDCGQPLAASIAESLLLPYRRKGRTPQVGTLLKSQRSQNSRLQAVCEEIALSPDKRWNVSDIASQAFMSERTLHRKFLSEVGISPSKYVENVRVEIAIGLLQKPGILLSTVARLSGLGGEQNLRRALLRVTGKLPSEIVEQGKEEVSPESKRDLCA